MSDDVDDVLSGLRLQLADEFLADITLHLFDEMRRAGPLSEAQRHRLTDIINEMADMHTEVAEQLENHR